MASDGMRDGAESCVSARSARADVPDAEVERAWTRRAFLSSTLALGAGCVGAARPKSAAQGALGEAVKAHYNVLLIVVDDLNTTLGCYGHPYARTPHIDRLVSRGLLFSRAYCQFPLCNPSRSSFLTGFRPDSSRVIDGVTHFRAARPDAVTLPQHFHRQGYFTAGLSKVFHDAAGMDDTCEWDYAQAFSDTAISQQGAGGWLYRGDGSCCAWRASEGEDDDLRDGQAVTEAIRQIEAHPDQLFLAVGLHKPHDPFVAPKKYFDLYPPEIIDLPADPPDARAGLPPLALTVRFDFSAAEMRALRRAYAASVSFVDAQVGRLVAALERRSLLERTVIVLLGDNGHHLGEHGHWGKAALFEQATRVPLIIAAPGLPARGQTCARPVELIGLFATLCDLCGLPLPSGIQGASLSPLLDDPAQAWAPAYMQQTRGDLMGRSIRMDRYRYTEWDAGRAGCELYDHDLDAGEYRNLAADPSYASVRQALQQRLREGPLT